jgi:hypothetical protein
LARTCGPSAAWQTGSCSQPGVSARLRLPPRQPGSCSAHRLRTRTRYCPIAPLTWRTRPGFPGSAQALLRLPLHRRLRTAARSLRGGAAAAAHRPVGASGHATRRPHRPACSGRGRRRGCCRSSQGRAPRCPGRASGKRLHGPCCTDRRSGRLCCGQPCGPYGAPPSSAPAARGTGSARAGEARQPPGRARYAAMRASVDIQCAQHSRCQRAQRPTLALPAAELLSAMAWHTSRFCVRASVVPAPIRPRRPQAASQPHRARRAAAWLEAATGRVAGPRAGGGRQSRGGAAHVRPCDALCGLLMTKRAGAAHVRAGTGHEAHARV